MGKPVEPDLPRREISSFHCSGRQRNVGRSGNRPLADSLGPMGRNSNSTKKSAGQPPPHPLECIGFRRRCRLDSKFGTAKICGVNWNGDSETWRVPQSVMLSLVDPPFLSAALESRLGFHDAVLHGFHCTTAHHHPPSSCPMHLEDHVCVHQYGAAVPDHEASYLRRTRDAVHREQVRKIVDAQLKQCRSPAH